ncbi:MAG: EFR1 family ferrodoxin, partial [bacterium]
MDSRQPAAAVFYYLSGTGNSYRAACGMAEECRLHGIPATVLSIAGTGPRTIEARADSLLALVTPVHGFTTPWLMIKFALRMPRLPGTPAIVVVTRGGSIVGKRFLPGMEGTAAYLLALILALKGCSIRGVMGLDMPVNWTALHPGLSEGAARAIVRRAGTRLNAFMAGILAGRRQLGGFVPLLLGLLLLPVSTLYLIVGRLWLAKLFFASHRCTGCGLCAAGCPAGAIRMLGRQKRRPYWTYSCESCMRCMNACPVRAVEASHPFAVVSYFIATVPAWIMLINWMAKQWPALAAMDNFAVRAVLKYCYMLTSIALAYGIFIMLARVPLLARLFAITT